MDRAFGVGHLALPDFVNWGVSGLHYLLCVAVNHVHYSCLLIIFLMFF